jgi:hypothetical protein
VVGEPPHAAGWSLSALVDQRAIAPPGALGRRYEAIAYVFDMAAQLQKQRHLFDAATFSPKDVESPHEDWYAVKESLA